jgi:L-threonylcarbamoyladenylate synthase
MVQTLSINPSAFTAEELTPALDALRAGCVVAYPTDTLYGLAVDPRRREAVDALFRIKGRPAGWALPLIAADLAQVTAVSRLSSSGERLAARFWPGPLTLVMRAIATLARGVAAEDGTVAVRVPAHDVARALAAGFGFPLTATSANRSGELPAENAADIRASLGDDISVLVDAGRVRGGAPSTIVDVTTDAPRLVREGVVPWSRVLESLQ